MNANETERRANFYARRLILDGVEGEDLYRAVLRRVSCRNGNSAVRLTEKQLTRGVITRASRWVREQEEP